MGNGININMALVLHDKLLIILQTAQRYVRHNMTVVQCSMKTAAEEFEMFGHVGRAVESFASQRLRTATVKTDAANGSE